MDAFSGAAEMRVALTAFERILKRLDDATTILSDHAKPDGPDCDGAISALYQALDSRGVTEEINAAQAAVGALRARLGPRPAAPQDRSKP